MEAVRTNVLGTENVITGALTNGVKRLVLLSTDKAVYPINAMGISKAMAEKVLVARSRTMGREDPVLCATRYGNVMADRKSTRLNSVTNAHIECRLMLEKKKNIYTKQHR